MSATRCSWATTPLLAAYHDDEWGVPVRDDRTLFEFLTLEGAQAGLSWETVLKKRDRYREVFHDFQPERVARMTTRDIERLMKDPGIIRNRAKIEATIGNAKAVLAVQREHGSFAAYVWAFDDASRLSKDLRARGFRFVGPTIAYAFMQATGMVNDHSVECAWHDRTSRP